MFNIKTYKQILLIAFPIMIGMVSQNIIQITNTAFLGRLGEEALGVSAMGGLFYMLLSVLSWGFSNGTNISCPKIGRKTIQRNWFANDAQHRHHVYLCSGGISCFTIWR